MSQLEQFDVLVLGSGQGGQLIAWHLAQAGRRTALVERRWIGGSCPNIACMPSKTEIWSARVGHLARHGEECGFVAPKTLEVRLNEGGKRVLAADQVFLNLGTRAAIPEFCSRALPRRALA